MCVSVHVQDKTLINSTLARTHCSFTSFHFSLRFISTKKIQPIDICRIFAMSKGNKGFPDGRRSPGH